MDEKTLVTDDQLNQEDVQHALYMNYCIARRDGMPHTHLIKIGFPPHFQRFYDSQHLSRTED